MGQMVGAVILAAGSSSRMGQPKQLLPLGGVPMLERVIRTALSVDFAEVFAVIGSEADEIQRQIRLDDPRFRWLVNPDYREGQSTSLRLGFQHALAACRGVMVLLGDMPLLSAVTVDKVMAEGRRRLQQRNNPFVVQPACEGKPGHPVFFGHFDASVWSALQGDQGARTVIRGGGCDRFFVPVADPGIFCDIDTPEAYEKALLSWEENFT